MRLGEEDLSNTLHCKYLGVLQSEDGDLLAVNRRITNPSFRNLKKDSGRYKATDKTTARTSIVLTLLYDSESWKLTEKVYLKINQTRFENAVFPHLLNTPLIEYPTY